MTAQLSRRLIRTAGLTLALSALAVSLSACANTNPVPATSSSNTATAEPTPDTKPSTPAGAITSVPFGKTCDDILSPEALYELKGGANYSPNPNFTPAAGSTAAKIVAMQGATCGYVNETSGETFNISVAEVTPDSAAALKAQIASEFGANTLVASYSPNSTIQGYFKVANGIGEAQVGTSIYWISIASKTFEEPADVLQLVQDVETSLGR